MLERTHEEWHDIRVQALELSDSLLWEAVLEVLQKRANSHLSALDNSKTPINAINFAQGCRFELTRAIMVLADIIRQADKHTRKRRSDEDEEDG